MLSLFECFLLHPTLVPYMFFEFLFHCLLVGTVSFDGQMLFFANFMYHHYPMFFNVVLPPGFFNFYFTVYLLALYLLMDKCCSLLISCTIIIQCFLMLYSLRYQKASHLGQGHGFQNITLTIIFY
jgi:hypothetical protein